MRSKPGVVAPIVGVTKANHLEEAIAAVAIVLDLGAVAEVERCYVPRAVAGQ